MFFVRLEETQGSPIEVEGMDTTDAAVGGNTETEQLVAQSPPEGEPSTAAADTAADPGHAHPPSSGKKSKCSFRDTEFRSVKGREFFALAHVFIVQDKSQKI